MITRRDIIVSTLAASVTLAVVALAQTNPKPMESSAFRWDQLKAETKPHGARRGVFDTRTATLERLECHITTLNPGQIPHPPHHHPEEEIIIIKEGTIEALQNGVTNRVGPGSILFEASNQEHGLRNVGETPATYFVVKWVSTATPKSEAKPSAM